MNRLLTTVLIAFTSFLYLGCKKGYDFCAIHNYEKREIIEHKLDSLLKTARVPKIIDQYQKIAQFETLAFDDTRKVDIYSKISIQNNESGVCLAELRALQFLSESKNYLNFDLKEYIPILTFDSKGEIIDISVKIRFLDHRGNEVLSNEVINDSFFDKAKIEAIKTSKSQRVANYLSKVESANLHRIKEAEQKRKEILESAINIDDLLIMSTKNKSKFEEEYWAEVVRVKGKVKHIGKMVGEMSVFFETNNNQFHTRCIGLSESSISSISLKHTLVIEGVCNGFINKNDFIFSDCKMLLTED